MKIRITMLAVSFLIVSLAGFTYWQNRPASGDIGLNLFGTEGLPIAGTVVLDGDAQDFSGVLPTNLTFKGRTFDFTIRMKEAHGALRCKFTVPGSPPISTGASGDSVGLHGSYSRNWGDKKVSVSAFGGIQEKTGRDVRFLMGEDPLFHPLIMVR